MMREALESEHVSQHLHSWIDLIFGCKQRGGCRGQGNMVCTPSHRVPANWPLVPIVQDSRRARPTRCCRCDASPRDGSMHAVPAVFDFHMQPPFPTPSLLPQNGAGQAAEDACNVFYYLTYEGAADLDAIQEPAMVGAAAPRPNSLTHQVLHMLIKNSKEENRAVWPVHSRHVVCMLACLSKPPAWLVQSQACRPQAYPAAAFRSGGADSALWADPHAAVQVRLWLWR